MSVANGAPSLLEDITTLLDACSNCALCGIKEEDEHALNPSSARKFPSIQPMEESGTQCKFPYQSTHKDADHAKNQPTPITPPAGNGTAIMAPKQPPQSSSSSPQTAKKRCTLPDILDPVRHLRLQPQAPSVMPCKEPLNPGAHNASQDGSLSLSLIKDPLAPGTG